jgi:hypothetical protein
VSKTGFPGTIVKTWPGEQLGQVNNVAVEAQVGEVKVEHTLSPADIRSICGSLSGSAAAATPARKGKAARPKSNSLMHPSSNVGQPALDYPVPMSGFSDSGTLAAKRSASKAATVFAVV